METKCYCGHTTRCDCGPETLEEAAERYIAEDNNNRYYNDFINGAKWQQEQIGKSEFLQKLRGTLSDAEARRLIFEQFKNDRL
jgi:hypothetical protein